MSGSLDFRSGVGTQMTMASWSTQDVWIGRRGEASRLEGLLEHFGGHVGDIGLAARERCDAPWVRFETSDVEPGPCELDREGEADIALAHHGDPSDLVLDPVYNVKVSFLSLSSSSRCGPACSLVVRASPARRDQAQMGRDGLRSMLGQGAVRRRPSTDDPGWRA